MTDQQRSRHKQILDTLNDTKFTKANPLHAAELDLERKVLENEGREPPYTYRAIYF